MADTQPFVDLNWGLHHTNKQRKNGASNVTPRREPGRTAVSEIYQRRSRVKSSKNKFIYIYFQYLVSNKQPLAELHSIDEHFCWHL